MWPMTKMTPEQEAAYALDFGLARSDLPDDAQLAYDHLVGQRARAGNPPPPEPASGSVMPRRVSAAITAVGVPGGPGIILVLFPWLITASRQARRRGRSRCGSSARP
jgi:hypothetical protein